MPLETYSSWLHKQTATILGHMSKYLNRQSTGQQPVVPDKSGAGGLRADYAAKLSKQSEL